MKNVTISLSEDLVHILDTICKDYNTSRYAFAKEAILEKIERHTKNESKAEVGEKSLRGDEKATDKITEDNGSRPPFIKVVY